MSILKASIEKSTKKSDLFSLKNSSNKLSNISFKSNIFNKEGDTVPLQIFNNAVQIY